MLLELKWGGRKGVGKGQSWVLVRTNVCGGPHQRIGSLTQACAERLWFQTLIKGFAFMHYINPRLID